MIVDENYTVSFQLIAAVGDSKSESMQAVRYARSNNLWKPDS